MSKRLIFSLVFCFLLLSATRAQAQPSVYQPNQLPLRLSNKSLKASGLGWGTYIWDKKSASLVSRPWLAGSMSRIKYWHRHSNPMYIIEKNYIRSRPWVVKVSGRPFKLSLAAGIQSARLSSSDGSPGRWKFWLFSAVIGFFFLDYIVLNLRHVLALPVPGEKWARLEDR